MTGTAAFASSSTPKTGRSASRSTGTSGAIAVSDRATGEVTARPEDVDIVVAPIDLKMRSAIALRSLSGNPIVLVDDLGRMAGLCGDDEIYRALLQQRRAAGEA